MAECHHIFVLHVANKKTMVRIFKTYVAFQKLQNDLQDIYSQICILSAVYAVYKLHKLSTLDMNKFEPRINIRLENH